MRRLAVIALLIAALAVGCARRHRGEATGAGIETAVVRSGAFDITIPMMGHVEAAEGVPIVNRYATERTGWRGQIEWLAEDGKRVEKGELVVKLDASDTERALRQLELDLKIATEATREAEASGEREVQNAAAALAKARELLELAETEAKAGAEKDESTLTFAQEQLAAAQAELAKCERLAQAKLVPRSRVEAAADAVAEKQFQVDKAKEERAANKAKRELEAASHRLKIKNAEVAHKNALLRQRLNVAKALVRERSIRREHDETVALLEQARILAPASGLLMYELTWDFGWRPLRVGDTVGGDRCIARIVSFERLVVRCQFGELDMARIKKDQDARVRVLGLAGRTFRGRVQVVENLAIEGDPWEGVPAGKRICRAMVEVLGSHPRLRPGMTATVQVVVGRSRGLHVPVECLFAESPQPVVYRREGARFRPIPVEAGPRGDLMCAITGDVDAGDEVARTRPPRRLIVSDRITAKG